MVSPGPHANPGLLFQLFFVAHVPPPPTCLLLCWQEAAGAYTRANALHEGPDKLLEGVLLNLSACHLKLGAAPRALDCALAALAVSGSAAPKAFYRAATALDALPHAAAAAALWAMLRSAELSGCGPEETRKRVAALSRPLPSAVGRPTSSGELKDGLEGVVRAQASAVGEVGALEPAAAASTSAPASACEAKELGNALFRSGDFGGALSSYAAALGLAPQRAAVATLLANRAACGLQSGGRASLLAAALDARAALVTDPLASQPKAVHRYASALLALGWTGEAGAAVDAGLRRLPPADAADVAKLKRRIETGTAATTGGAASGKPSSTFPSVAGSGGRGGSRGGSTNFGLKSEAAEMRVISEREMKRLEEHDSGGYFGVEERARSNLMYAALSAKALKGLPLLSKAPVDSRVPPFHKEYAAEGRLPPGCNAAKCYALLWEGFENAYGIPQHELRYCSSTSGESINRSDLIHRLGCYAAESLDWFAAAKIGELRVRPHYPYNPGVHHSFCNSPVPVEALTPGKCHVSIGFVDLGGLSAALSIEGRGLAGDPPSPEQRVVWVGYESSAYAVAKTTVIAAMVQGAADVDSILQVWYSAAWSRRTAGAFRDALTYVLSAASSAGLAPEVRSFLQHWQLKEVSLSESRAKWLEAPNIGHVVGVANFVDKRDRMALCHYVLTGELLQSDVGSVVMFSLPPGGGAISMQESVLQVRR